MAVEDYSFEKEKTAHSDLLAIKSITNQAGALKVNLTADQKNAEVTEIPKLQNHPKLKPNFGVQKASTNKSILSFEPIAKTPSAKLS